MLQKDFDKIEATWTPKEDSGIKVKKFRERIKKKYKVHIGDDYWSLHKWTVEHVANFWAEIWDEAEVIYSEPYQQVVDLSVGMENNPEWFQGAMLNYAENLLKYRDDHVALIVAGEDRDTETVTYAQLYKEACRFGAAFRKVGLKKGDTVACYMSNRKEAIYAMLGATSVGAIWGGPFPILGAKAAINRLLLVKPRFLFTVDRFKHNGEEYDMLEKVEEIAKSVPSLEKVIIVPSRADKKRTSVKTQNRLKSHIEVFSSVRWSCYLEDFLLVGDGMDGSVPALEFEQLPFSHPVYFNYTSGTTGTPKTFLHGAGCLLSTYRDLWLQDEGSRHNTWLSTSPVGWQSWTLFASALFLGIRIVVYEGEPLGMNSDYFWDMVDEYNITNLFLTPGILDDMEKRNIVPGDKHHLNSLKTIFGVASVVKPQNIDFVYKKIKSDVVFGSAYGSTELMGAGLKFDHTLPIYKAELAAPCLGIDACCYNDSGESVVGDIGELVITTPTPSFPLCLLDDNDGKRYKEIYFSKFPGVFAPGDVCYINPVTKGFVMLGRSDDTLKQNGIRFGCSDIYNVVATFPEIRDSLCISQYGKNRDERVVLFVKMKDGELFTPDLVYRICEAIENELTRDHVPEVILETNYIPYNVSGKKMEIIVKKIINGLPYSSDTVKNAECLEFFRNIPDLKGF